MRTEVALFPIFGVLFLALAVVIWLIAGQQTRVAAFRPRLIAPYLRYSLGFLGVLVFLYVGFATCQDVNERYKSGLGESGTTVTVPLATQPPPSEQSGFYQKLDTKDLRFHILVSEKLAGVTRAVHVESFGSLSTHAPVEWTQREFEVNSVRLSVRIKPSEALWYPSWFPPLEKTPTLMLNANVEMVVSLPGAGDLRFSSGGSQPAASFPLCRYAASSRGTYPGSLERTNTIYTVWGMAMLGMPGSGDKVMPMEEFASLCHATPQQHQPSFIGDVVMDPDVHAIVSTPARGIALLMCKGWGVLAIFACTALTSQVFRRRQIAFAGLMILSVLYIAALDRYAVSVNIAHMKDSAAPITTRLKACQSLRSTFFYKETARKAYTDLLHSKSEPEPLKDAVREAHTWL